MFSSFILVLSDAVQSPVLSGQALCLPTFSYPVLSCFILQLLCFSILFWCDFCVMFLWIMLHPVSQTYCILCWDSPSSPLWVWFIGSWWDLEVSLHIYILLYQFINPLACWFVAETFYCFPCVTLLNRGMSRHVRTYARAHTHTHTHTHVWLPAPCAGSG